MYVYTMITRHNIAHTKAFSDPFLSKLTSDPLSQMKSDWLKVPYVNNAQAILSFPLFPKYSGKKKKKKKKKIYIYFKRIRVKYIIIIRK